MRIKKLFVLLFSVLTLSLCQCKGSPNKENNNNGGNGNDNPPIDQPDDGNGGGGYLMRPRMKVILMMV